MNSKKDSGPKTVVVALAGNPNAGKTSLFNALTGAHQKVGNYPGVTVEQVEGTFEHAGITYRVVDLPGTYSLAASSQEELVARRFLAEQEPDVVVDVVDSTNLDRNLYLAIQLLEMGANLVLALNMADEAEKEGLILDIDQLSKVMVGVPVVRTQGHKGVGIEDLKSAIVRAAAHPIEPPALPWTSDIAEAVDAIERTLAQMDTSPYRKRWTALKLLEDDEEVTDLLRSRKADDVLAEVGRQRERLLALLGEEPAITLADQRYGFVAGLLKETVRREAKVDRYELTDKIDKILLHRYLGFPIFGILLYAIFWLTFSAGGPLADLIDQGLGGLAHLIQNNWPESLGAMGRSLLVNGIIGGVGAVLVFLPNVLILFLGLAFLEDTGYMARAAFLMDRVMHKVGLHGKSFIPMVVGFGCNVPAVLATRVLEDKRDRLVTILVIPLFACSARLTGFVLIVSAFFPPARKAAVLMGIYVFGVLLAGLLAKLLRMTILSGEDAPFVMELPPYRMPTLRAISVHAARRSWLYVKKAGTIILAISLVIWVLSSFPRYRPDAGTKMTRNQQASAQLEHSFAGRIGKAFQPALSQMGLDWRMGTAFLGAVAAKEVFVTQAGIVLSATDDERTSLVARLRHAYSPAAAVAMILFLLIASPCIATFAAVRQETGSWKWPIFQWTFLTLLGYALAVVGYHVASMFGYA